MKQLISFRMVFPLLFLAGMAIGLVYTSRQSLLGDPPGGIGGMGTTNPVARFTGSTTIGDSLLNDNGVDISQVSELFKNLEVIIRSYARAALPTAGNAGRLARVSDNGPGLCMDKGSQWFALSGDVINVKELGAKGDGITDDTDAIQSALNLFGRATRRSGSMFFPIGEYKITRTLTYEGTPGLGIHIKGALGGTRGPTGSRLVWEGLSGGKMMYLLGANGSTIEDLEFNGRSITHTALHLDATNVEIPGNAGSSGNVLRRITIGGVVGVDSAAIALGHSAAATSQVSEIDMYDLVLVGDHLGNSYYGIKTWVSGNTKNFKLTGGTISGFRYGVDWSAASGVFLVKGVILGTMTISDFRVGTGNLHIDSVESETSSARFVIGSTGANPGSLVITNSSWQAAAPPDDVIIEYSGHVTLTGNTFFNYRTPLSYPKIRVGGNLLMTSTDSGAGITSIGNFYQNAPRGPAPFIDSSGNDLFTSTGYYAGKDLAAMSIGDYGGNGGHIYHLTNRLPPDGLRPLP